MRRREDGTYEAVDWDTAISEITERMTAVRDRWGGDKILFYGGGGQGNHLGGTYVGARLKALGVRYRSNALAVPLIHPTSRSHPPHSPRAARAVAARDPAEP